MQFRTPAGDGFDVPDDLLWACAAPIRAMPRTVYEYAPSELLETRVVPIALVRPPQRLGDIVHFKPDRTIHILTGMIAGDPLPPVHVVEFPGDAYPYRVRDGFHRYHLSLVCGFSELPLAVDPWNEPWMWREAEEPQRSAY